MPDARHLPDVQWWLAELDQYGNAKLCDGPHDARSAVERALYLRQRLGMAKMKRFAAAEVMLTEVVAAPHGANEEALRFLNDAGLRP